MAAKDDTERVLRDIHVMFSKAQPADGSAINVIVNKNDMMDLLKELNSCMYEMMDEYELTKQSRAKAERELLKEGDDIVFDSKRKAEDIYAASVMYTDNALGEIQDIMRGALEQYDILYNETKKKQDDLIRQIKKNQSDLRAELSDLIDTQKYLKLIEEENRAKAKAKESDKFDSSLEDKIYANVQSEIIVNEDYFRAQGITPDGTPLNDTTDEALDEALMRDLDNEYFDWKSEDNDADTDSADSAKSKVINTIGSLFGKK